MTGEESALYDDLSAPFEGYYTAEGIFGPFLSGEQIAKRLNHVLGPGGWQFHVVQYTYDQASDEITALGELRAFIGGQWVTRQQFGGQKLNRKKDGSVNNFSDDHKGAATDAMKKCASLLGVGLYLMVSSATWHEGTPQRVEKATSARTGRSSRNGRPTSPPQQADAPAPSQSDAVPPALPPGTNVYRCNECRQPLQPVTIPARDGKPPVKWTIAKLRYQSLRRHGTVLCRDCWRKAEDLIKAGVAS